MNNTICNNGSSTSGSNALRCVHLRCANFTFSRRRRTGNVSFCDMNGNAVISRYRTCGNSSSNFRFFNNSMGIDGLMTMDYDSSSFS